MNFFTKHIIKIVLLLWLFLCGFNHSDIIISNTLNGTDFVSFNSKYFVTNQDTITSTKITKVWYTQAELNVEVYQVQKQQNITITVYNMLGKEVLEVFKGISSTRTEEVYSATFNLPNGIYICVLQGNTFRDSEKFIISR
ncbi:MAG: T9SS type A sorting domain-containing protein [Candidatus Kapabacteria bacterium]|nr:T9SS type A sorting domain-containing protein [Ignavibacteriota bacterium]MCW5883482.1 T9SS type A sorting domain-containing protein [Candidatus Kapabacteria bacterium]